MAKRTVYLEKIDAGPRHSGLPDAAFKGYWQGALDGCVVSYTTGIVGRGARPPVSRTFATAAEAERAFEAHIATQRLKGFEELAPEPARSAIRTTRMGASAELRFHRQLLASLGVTPRTAADSQAIIAERERVCGVIFPASVKEWFSLADVFELFREHTNEDELITNEHRDDIWQLTQLGDPRETSQGYLRVAVENQGVVAWYVKLDGTIDPAVFHNDGDWESPLAAIEWVACSDSFSAFLRDMMLDR